VPEAEAAAISPVPPSTACPTAGFPSSTRTGARTHERGVETLEPDLEAGKRILAGQHAILDGMRSA